MVDDINVQFKKCYSTIDVVLFISLLTDYIEDYSKYYDESKAINEEIKCCVFVRDNVLNLVSLSVGRDVEILMPYRCCHSILSLLNPSRRIEMIAYEDDGDWGFVGGGSHCYNRTMQGIVQDIKNFYEAKNQEANYARS